MNTSGYGLIGKNEDTCDLFEAMETDKNPLPHTTKVKTGTLASNKTCQQQMWVLENGRNVKYGTYE